MLVRLILGDNALEQDISVLFRGRAVTAQVLLVEVEASGRSKLLVDLLVINKFR